MSNSAGGRARLGDELFLRAFAMKQNTVMKVGEIR